MSHEPQDTQMSTCLLQPPCNKAKHNHMGQGYSYSAYKSNQTAINTAVSHTHIHLGSGHLSMCSSVFFSFRWVNTLFLASLLFPLFWGCFRIIWCCFRQLWHHFKLLWHSRFRRFFGCCFRFLWGSLKFLYRELQITHTSYSTRLSPPVNCFLFLLLPGQYLLAKQNFAKRSWKKYVYMYQITLAFQRNPSLPFIPCEQWWEGMEWWRVWIYLHQ